jgi:hypothetical protein
MIALMSASPVDPNWLYSTGAQAAAALVAIIGGFLVSRLIAMSSERQALGRRRQQLQDEVAAAGSRIEDLYVEVWDAARAWFRRNNKDDFVVYRGTPPNFRLEENIYRGVGMDETQEFASELERDVQTTFLMLERILRTGEISMPDDQELSRRGLKVEEIPKDLQSDIAEAIAKRRRPKQSSMTGYQSYIPPFIPSVTPFSLGRDAERQDSRNEMLDAVERRRDDRQAEIRLLDRQLGELGRPQGVGWGIASLALLTILGIVFPMILMAVRPVPAGPLARAAVIVSFCVGVAAVLLFVGYQWINARGRVRKEVRESKGRESVGSVNPMGWGRVIAFPEQFAAVFRLY